MYAHMVAVNFTMDTALSIKCNKMDDRLSQRSEHYKNSLSAKTPRSLIVCKSFRPKSKRSPVTTMAESVQSECVQSELEPSSLILRVRMLGRSVFHGEVKVQDSKYWCLKQNLGSRVHSRLHLLRAKSFKRLFRRDSDNVKGKHGTASVAYLVSNMTGENLGAI